jgi:hypothetical protein
MSNIRSPKVWGTFFYLFAWYLFISLFTDAFSAACNDRAMVNDEMEGTWKAVVMVNVT